MGARVSRRWWEQEGIDRETANERAAESKTIYSESEAESEAESEDRWGRGVSASSAVSVSSG